MDPGQLENNANRQNESCDHDQFLAPAVVTEHTSRGGSVTTLEGIRSRRYWQPTPITTARCPGHLPSRVTNPKKGLRHRAPKQGLALFGPPLVP